METLFYFLFGGQSFQSLVELVKSLDTFQQIVFIFWLSCVVMFYSILLYIIYLIGKDLVVKLFTKLKLVK